MNAPSDKMNGNGCATEPDPEHQQQQQQQRQTTDDIDDIEDGDYKAITTISSDISLPNDVLERIFQRYSIKQRCAGLESFLITSVLFDFWIICTVQQDRNYDNIGKLSYTTTTTAAFVCVIGYFRYRLATFVGLQNFIILIHTIFSFMLNVLAANKLLLFSCPFIRCLHSSNVPPPLFHPVSTQKKRFSFN